MIPIGDNRIKRTIPTVTWTLVALNVIIFLWDRQGHLFGGNVVFADLVMRPKDVVDALHRGYDHFPVATIFTSMYLHANIVHITGNMIFLLVFGSSVEAAVGHWRFAIYYLFWGVIAAATHIYIDPASTIPTLGASGAIGGVLGAYFLIFPASKVEILVPILAFLSFELSAWIVLGLWFLYQIFIPQEGVANWAHVGGFLAGMVTVLIMGGRAAILKGRENEFDDDFQFPTTT
jgi:membrane associated rhomboid family serine protease